MWQTTRHATCTHTCTHACHTHTHAHTHARAHTHTPKHLVIRYSWSMSDSPGKRGSPVNISENNEPMAQMSIALMRESTQRLDACDQSPYSYQLSFISSGRFRNLERWALCAPEDFWVATPTFSHVNAFMTRIIIVVAIELFKIAGSPN